MSTNCIRCITGKRWGHLLWCEECIKDIHKECTSYEDDPNNFKGCKVTNLPPGDYELHKVCSYCKYAVPQEEE